MWKNQQLTASEALSSPSTVPIQSHRTPHNTPLLLLGTPENLGAGVGITGCIVMVQGNVKVGGDGLQLMVAKLRPDLAGYGHGVNGMQALLLKAVVLRKGEQHSKIKPRIVGGDHPFFQIRPDQRPQLVKIRFPGDVAPGDPVNAI